MRLRAGTSGFAYKEWKGSFYPEDLADAGMLEYYAGRLPTVEVNNTFYRMPTPKLIERWVESTSPAFRFVLKTTRRVSHKARLRADDDLLEFLFTTAGGLGERLGAHLVQLPPWAKIDLEALEGFLTRVPDGHRVAMEFRNESWFDDDVYALMRDHDAALVIADGGKVEVPFVATAGWGYLRLRGADYDDDALAAWADRIATAGWDEAFVFFKHEDEGAGPRMAERMLAVSG